MIKQMERHARANPSVISLGQGIPDAKAHPMIRQAVIHALDHAEDIDRYSDPLGLPALRHKISLQLHHVNMNYDVDEIIVTAGAIEAINACLQTFVSTSKPEVILPTPTYSAYSRAITCAKGVSVEVALHEDRQWQLDIEEVKAAVSPRTCAMLICNPNNPTGSLYSKETILALLELAKTYNFYLIIDEVYGNMIYDGRELYTPCTSDTYRKQIVRVVSFSKDFNLTGWRVGFLHGGRKVIKKIVPIHDTLVNCAPVVSQYAAIAALDIYKTIINDNRGSYLRRRNIMADYLHQMSEWFDTTLPSGGYFFFPRLLGSGQALEFCQDLLKIGIIAIPGDDFGPGGEQHIRLCFGRSEADIHTGMQRIKSYVESTSKNEFR